VKVRDRIDVICELFLGAMHADQRTQQAESNAVRRILCDLLLVDELPPLLERRIQNFDPARFSLSAAAQDFVSDPPMSKRRLLELVGHICHADGILDFAEDTYMRDLARALGMKPEEYEDLVLDYEIDELRKNLQRIRMTPIEGMTAAKKTPSTRKPRSLPPPRRR
jgi:uncharacterized tellurite resistance protein B-like protein